ncbi:hypothetical protein Aduo_017385 [Ancylostoma duodenale]
MGELSNGLSILVSGIFRMLFLVRGQFLVEVHSRVCFFATPWPIMMLFAGQFPSFLTLTIAFERVLAVESAIWYRCVWKNRHRFCLIGIALALTLATSRDEVRRQRMVLTITGISVAMVSIPNVAVVIDEWEAVQFGEMITGIIYCMYGIHSGFSIFVYATFRPDFRKRLLSMIGFKSSNTLRPNISPTISLNKAEKHHLYDQDAYDEHENRTD